MHGVLQRCHPARREDRGMTRRAQKHFVISVFSEADTKCDTSVGFNNLFGSRYCRSYSELDRDCLVLYVK